MGSLISLVGLLGCDGAAAPSKAPPPVSAPVFAPAEPETKAALQPRADSAPRKATGPRLRVLGIAQDGGLPHVACDCVRCEAARVEPSRASFVASLGIIGADDRGLWLVDATPDLPAQLELLDDVLERRHAAGSEGQPTLGRVDRSPLDGIALTHAHMGHYLGLAHLGFEAGSTSGVRVLASARMVDFLRANAPWDQLVALANIAPAVAPPGEAVELRAGDGASLGVRATALSVPHRGEYTDTYAWYLEGARAKALYVPDTNPWPQWTAEAGLDLDAVLDGVDLLLVDATFYSGDELPGRDTTKIGHPLVVDTMALLEGRLSEDFAVWFVHLNHSNPALDPRSLERAAIEARGFRVATVGDEFAL